MGEVVACAAVLAWLVALSVFDVTARRLPNWLTLPGALVIVAAAFAAGRGGAALIGASALFLVYVTVHLLAPAAMGAGDVKLAIGLGALTGSLGVDVWALSALTAPLVTATWAVVAVICRRESTVPHGLSMCLAAATATGLAVY
ncbi:A24 family peptidase [Mycobacterium sp. 852014-52144_SCH5372336]|uniref:prepilin peptidase n=1 Tax=Mycobacterium sp. 852014-52144_SCH5372336 TaxID=1834115 RepID=UPI0007FC6216|nr:A24 family peptidase [Mycobacterium sp. 852014-52144_SCH5372336]OBB73878.1 peptidase A24 [Mycobacterium sp. 852014-52144_SCH5372336]